MQSAELLLDCGANLNAYTEWGDTAVHYAAFSGSVDILRYHTLYLFYSNLLIYIIKEVSF